jgi:hypothetical protein
MRTSRHENINGKGGQLSCELRQPLKLRIGVTRLKPQVAALNVAEVVQAFPELFESGRVVRRRVRVEHAHGYHLALCEGVLCTGARCREKPARRD